MSRHETLLQLIDETARVLDKPQHWCRKTAARNAHGAVVKPWATDAVEFCLTGAIERVCWLTDNIQLEPAMKGLFEAECWPVGLAVVNDYEGTDFAEIRRIIGAVRHKVEQNAAS